MPAARIICPACKTVMTSAQAFEAGKLVDCPTCRLLFAPTANDLASQRTRSFELAAERSWASADDPPPSPQRTPYSSRRRIRGFTTAEMAYVGLACVVIMASAAVVVGISYFALPGISRPQTQPTVRMPSPAAVGNSATLPSARSAEVDDDRPAPSRPVPSLDDDPPGKPPP
jgi:hypothetical protein